MKPGDGALVALRTEAGIGFLTFDLPGEKVNKLSREVMARLRELLSELASRTDVRGVVIDSAKDGMFLAGADVHEIRAVADPGAADSAAREGQAIMDAIEALPFPVVAAIGGVCLGGGTEIALACHARVGSDHPRFQIGLPEVNLGILPAWGGTTRLPRLVGLRNAMDLILTGRAIDARKAERIGLLDRAVPHGQLRQQALRLVEEIASGTTRKPRPWSATDLLLEKNPLGRRVLFAQARKRVLARTRGHYPAPLAVLEVLQQGFSSRSRSFELERAKLRELLPGEVSKNLVHLFFLHEGAKKPKGIEADISQRTIERAGVLGAGTMGGGIARLFASRDISVRLKDVSPEALGAGLRAARALFEERRKRRRIGSWELERRMALIAPTTDWSGFGRVEVVLEAIVEDMEIKKEVLRELESVVPDDCLIGSNTSTLSIGEMQEVLQLPQRMAGFHFFNPVDRMPLVEVIRGVRTDDRTAASFVHLARRLGKTPVVVQDGPGFLVNRLLGPYLNEASHMLVETSDLEGIDRAFLRFGMPMGPLRLLDEVGIDVALKAGKVLAKAFGDRGIVPSGVLEALAAAGRLGKKSGIGFYRHRGNRAEADPEVPSLVGAQRSRLDPTHAVERGIGLMVAEAARALEEGVAGAPGDVDLAMVLGTGFPPFRGGLLRHAESYGLARIVEDLEKWRERKGSRFAPPRLLLERARSNGRFY